ncbi:hypothetical protein Tco_1433514 [Tanacetum coccineum]
MNDLIICYKECFALGYVRDKEATIATLDTEGWLKTGDLCVEFKGAYEDKQFYACERAATSLCRSVVDVGNDDSIMVDKLPKDEAKMRLKATKQRGH